MKNVDSEIKIMNSIANMLDKFDYEVSCRVLIWLNSRLHDKMRAKKMKEHEAQMAIAPISGLLRANGAPLELVERHEKSPSVDGGAA